jgi:hypothetical protein
MATQAAAPTTSMASEHRRRQVAYLIGIIILVAVYFELRHLGVSTWYSAGLGAIAGFIGVVIIAALIC